jgi:hypothetical protein
VDTDGAGCLCHSAACSLGWVDNRHALGATTLAVLHDRSTG